MGKLEDHIEELVDETMAGYEGILSPESMMQLRALLSDAFETHPVLRELANEDMPREVDQSGDVPLDPAADAAEIAKRGAKGA